MDGYLRSESAKANGRSPPIPLGTMGQFENGKLAGRRIFGPALSSAVNDFLKRIVQVSGSSLVTESGAVKTAAVIDHEGLEAVVRGVCSHTKSAPNKVRRGVWMLLPALGFVRQIPVCCVLITCRSAGRHDGGLHGDVQSRSVR
jgi:hypothetical protein